MIPSARLSAAIEVLSDIEARRRPGADALKDWGLSHRFAGAGDRAAIGNIVYDGLRRKRSAGWLLDADTPCVYVVFAGNLKLRNSVVNSSGTGIKVLNQGKMDLGTVPLVHDRAAGDVDLCGGQGAGLI